MNEGRAISSARDDGGLCENEAGGIEDHSAQNRGRFQKTHGRGRDHFRIDAIVGSDQATRRCHDEVAVGGGPLKVPMVIDGLLDRVDPWQRHKLIDCIDAIDSAVLDLVPADSAELVRETVADEVLLLGDLLRSVGIGLDAIFNATELAGGVRGFIADQAAHAAAALDLALIDVRQIGIHLAQPSAGPHRANGPGRHRAGAQELELRGCRSPLLCSGPFNRRAMSSQLRATRTDTDKVVAELLRIRLRHSSRTQRPAR
jgi:hypothetical protein